VDVLMHVLLALALVIITARAVGLLFGLLRQPPVIGEVLAGLLLGPSVLGRFAPGAAAYVLPPSVAPFLGLLAQVGVILYMFLVGLELDLSLVKRRTHATVAISHASIVVPFLLGAGLALVLYPRLSSSDVPFTSFALFCGVAMSVTAFPVLARILTDRGVQTSRLGVIALTCAAVDDVTAWCLLAFVVSVVNMQVGGALVTLLLTLGYLALIFGLVRPAIRRLVERHDRHGTVDKTVLAVVFVALLLSALATEYIGIHAIFGAFALGAIVPAHSKIARELIRRLEDFVVVLFLPAFFAFTGMRTQIGLVSGGEQWLLCGVVVLIACVGKFGGTVVAARATGFGWRESASLGVLMNTRGLMELIVLNIGLDLRVISPVLFAMLVIMAVLTTEATTPLLDLLKAFAVAAPEQAEPAFAAGGRKAT
jgi:Kef-type K+ transport system membrane component KefB